MRSVTGRTRTSSSLVVFRLAVRRRTMSCDDRRIRVSRLASGLLEGVEAIEQLPVV
jgi:hypothetical protein